MPENSQNYANPLFIEEERDKIVQEMVRGFKPYLATIPSNSIYAHFLRDEGLYAGPYKNTSADVRAKFARVADATGDQPGPRFNLTLDGSPSVYIPGMCKHAFNAGAADVNARLGGWNADDLKNYKSGAKRLEQMAWSVSEAVLAQDLNGALTAVYGRKWTEYTPSDDHKRDPKNDRI